MGFTSSLPPFFIAANKVADKIAKLPHRDPSKRQLDPWDPTRCNYFEQEAIGNAFHALWNVYAENVHDRGGDWETLGDLMKTQTVNSLSITCECRGGPPMSSNAQRKSLNICLDTSNRRYLETWLVVEAIHLCGGTDLDAWAIKNWLFNIDKTAPPWVYYALLPSEKDLMCKGGTKLPLLFNWLGGKFTVWDNVMGGLWPSTKDVQGRVSIYGNNLIAGGPPRGLWQWHC